MSSEQLFDNLAVQQAAREQVVGEARLREPRRDQIELRAVDIESLIGADHPARIIWGYVEGLDLRELEDAVKSRQGRPSHPAITPRLCQDYAKAGACPVALRDQPRNRQRASGRRGSVSSGSTRPGRRGRKSPSSASSGGTTGATKTMMRRSNRGPRRRMRKRAS